MRGDESATATRSTAHLPHEPAGIASCRARCSARAPSRRRPRRPAARARSISAAGGQLVLEPQPQHVLRRELGLAAEQPQRPRPPHIAQPRQRLVRARLEHLPARRRQRPQRLLSKRGPTGSPSPRRARTARRSRTDRAAAPAAGSMPCAAELEAVARPSGPGAPAPTSTDARGQVVRRAATAAQCQGSAVSQRSLMKPDDRHAEAVRRLDHRHVTDAGQHRALAARAPSASSAPLPAACGSRSPQIDQRAAADAGGSAGEVE